MTSMKLPPHRQRVGAGPQRQQAALLQQQHPGGGVGQALEGSAPDHRQRIGWGRWRCWAVAQLGEGLGQLIAAVGPCGAALRVTGRGAASGSGEGRSDGTGRQAGRAVASGYPVGQPVARGAATERGPRRQSFVTVCNNPL
jgi:hypothetical protein